MIRENAENGRKKGKFRGYERLAERALNFSPTLPAIRRGSLCGCGAGPTPFTQPKLYNSSTSKQIVSYSMTTVVRLASCADLVHEGTTQITYDFRVCRFHIWSYCTDTGLLCTRFPSLPFIPPPTSLLWTHLAVAFHFDWRISVSKRHPFFFFVRPWLDGVFGQEDVCRPNANLCLIPLKRACSHCLTFSSMQTNNCSQKSFLLQFSYQFIKI